MTVDYIHYIIPYSEMTVLGNLPTFFYFGITLLALKKKSYKLHVIGVTSMLGCWSSAKNNKLILLARKRFEANFFSPQSGKNFISPN